MNDTDAKNRIKKFIRTISSMDLYTTCKRKGMAVELLLKTTFDEGTYIPVKSQKKLKKALEEYYKKNHRVKRNFDIILPNNEIRSFNWRLKKNSKIIFNNDYINNIPKLILQYKSKGKIIQKEFNDSASLMNYLFIEGFIRKRKGEIIVDNFTIDFFRIVDGKLCIIECKNKEKTGLSLKDIVQVLDYALAIKNIPDVEDIPAIGYALLVYNGASRNWNDKQDQFKTVYGVEIRIRHIREWLIEFSKRTGFKIDFLILSKVKLKDNSLRAISAGERSKIRLYISHSKYNPEEDYEPIDLLISDNKNEIKEFLKKDIKSKSSSII